ncbi:MAG: peptidoglycan DD-metalloendopeptidase family protein, partial [Limisphaerales bacterium]
CGTQTYNGHRGTDYTGSNASRNTPIYAAADGTIHNKVDGFGDGYGGNTDAGGAGNHVVLNHANGFRTYYLHMEKGTVTTRSIGSSVSCGTRIGAIGTSGNSTGLHLHFEPRKWNGSSYVADDPYAGPCSGPVSWWVDQTTGSPIAVCQGEDITPPGNLVATAVAHNRVELTWVDNSSIESGYKVERSLNLTGPWTELAVLPANSVSYSDTNLLPWSTFFYRVRGFNSNGESLNSIVANATTFNQPPILGGIPDRTVNEGNTLSFNVTSVDFALGQTHVLGSFETYADGTSSVLFRPPGYTVTSRVFLNSSPDESLVTAYFPTGNRTRRTLCARWSVSSSAVDPWIRLTTAHTPTTPNPVIGLNSIIKFSIFTEDSLKVGLGVREISSDLPLGEDGGVSGPIEFVGVPTLNGNTPDPSRTVSTRRWVDLEFDLSNEPVSPFTGDGILSSPHGKGVLEHLVLVPNAGWGSYRVWLDNFTVSLPNVLTYSLEPGAPEGATIHPSTGVFTWTPTEQQGPGVYEIGVRVTDNGVPAMFDTKTFTVTVNEVNQAPVLASISDKIVNAGSTLVFTNS